MAPTTRSARIAGFPDIVEDGATAHGKRQVPVMDHILPTEGEYLETVLSGKKPPIYTIDLSLPPYERYRRIATDYSQEIRGLTTLFQDVVAMTGIPLVLVTWLCRLFLRRLHSEEQTEEIKGIARVTGLDMYLIVAFNTLLDLFMGCTSGGIKVWAKHGTNGKSNRVGIKMLHFRTLDWGMDALRKVVVQLEFVERPNGPVIARSITYVGFVGILTGVRQDLSVSLNFRPYRNSNTSLRANIRFYSNHIMMLLGLRPSIASILRGYIIPAHHSAKTSLEKTSSTHPKVSVLPELAGIKEKLPKIPTTAAYLIFCSGKETTVFEKDHRTAEIYTSTSFIAATNHDAAVESDGSGHAASQARQTAAPGMQDLLGESENRKDCFAKNWRKAVKRHRRRHQGATEDDVAVDTSQVVRWVQTYPITNEETHYACVMDPSEGAILWVKQLELSEYDDIGDAGAEESAPSP